ncbi:MFS transporter [Pendulispora albinea]|uniref:MFS transporter n=1 Tax=Pendulispora albinea TaxID=2741071 RepID=A0ABZ2LTK2_9BACT
MTTTTPSRGSGRATFLFLQATAFLNAAGVGLVIPVLPFLAERHVGDPAKLASAVGWLAASYSLGAFLAAPALGALSDRVGRRPVLLLSLAGSAAGYLLSGLAGALSILFLGRLIDGLTAGNMGALFAYVGDTAPAEERTARFGKLGAVSGAGLIVGPALGGLAVKLGGVRAPFFFAAALVTFNVLWGLVFLPESLSPENRAHGVSWAKLNPFSQLLGLFEFKYLSRLLLAGVFCTAALVCLPTTFPLLAKDRLGWGADRVSFVVILVGATDILVQGFLLAHLERLFGGARLLLIGLGLTFFGFVSMALVAIYPSVPLFLAAIVGFAGGEGMFTSSFNARLSEAAGPSAQGRVQGGNHALSELTTAIVPILVTQLYARSGPGAPYWASAAVTAGACLLLPRVARPPAAVATAQEERIRP